MIERVAGGSMNTKKRIPFYLNSQEAVESPKSKTANDQTKELPQSLCFF